MGEVPTNGSWSILLYIWHWSFCTRPHLIFESQMFFFSDGCSSLDSRLTQRLYIMANYAAGTIPYSPGLFLILHSRLWLERLMMPAQEVSIISSSLVISSHQLPKEPWVWKCSAIIDDCHCSVSIIQHLTCFHSLHRVIIYCINGTTTVVSDPSIQHPDSVPTSNNLTLSCLTMLM